MLTAGGFDGFERVVVVEVSLKSSRTGIAASSWRCLMGARVIATWKQEQKGRGQKGKPKEVDRSSRQSPRTNWRRDEPLDPGLCAVLWTGILGYGARALAPREKKKKLEVRASREG